MQLAYGDLAYYISQIAREQKVNVSYNFCRGAGTQWTGRVVALPTVGFVRQTIHFVLPIFLNCIL